MISGSPSSVYSQTLQDSDEYSKEKRKRNPGDSAENSEENRKHKDWNPRDLPGYLKDLPRNPEDPPTYLKDLPRQDPRARANQQQFIDSLGLKRPDLYEAEVRI